MRTKALLGLAALAVGLSTSVAQNVYSLNVVGYVNVSLQANKAHFLAYPFQDVNGNFCITNTVVLNDPAGNDAQDFAEVYQWGGTTWNNPATWFGAGLGGTGWDTPLVISNGIGFFLISQAATTLTFVGQVPQGAPATSYYIPLGASTLANKIPVSTNFPGSTVGNDFDEIYPWSQSGQTWGNPTTFFGADLGGNGWDFDSTGNGLVLAPGQGCFYINGTAAINFSQNFTVQ